jgi:phosphatidylglycerol:prolipoprotein diacylglycerol transferase
VSPIIATVAGVPVYSYVVFLDAGVALGVALALWLAVQRGVPVPAALDTGLLAAGAALVGGRAGYVAVHWPEYASNPATALNVWEGGLALFGAVAGAARAGAAAARLHRLAIPAMLDLAAPATASAQAIGRLGCAAAGCAAGITAQPGQGLPALALPDAAGLVAQRFPSQYVEAGAELALALLLLAVWTRAPRAGTVAAVYAIGYGLVRAAAQPFREDSTLLGPLPWATWWSAAFVVAGCLALVALRLRTPPEHRAHQVPRAGHSLPRGA